MRQVIRAKHPIVRLAILLVALLPIGTAVAAVNSVTPSTNDINRTNGWAHVNVVDVGPGYTELEFVSTRSFFSCFEYRTDGDTSEILAENGGNNYNPDVTDGLYPYLCVNNNTATRTIYADEYVEVRMVFGAERDERFDWTRFDVDPILYVCEGFKPPADGDIVVKKPNRVVPLRMQLFDVDGMSIWDVAPPVVNINYEPANGDPAETLDELTFAGRGDEGNQFLFDGTFWAFNLSTKGFAPGVYTLTAMPGSSGYAINPTCEVVLTVQ
jgi:hypothetical protein